MLEIKDTKRKGDLAEYYAITWLWEQGFDVFQNSGCSGPVDIVAMDENGNTILIDVKTSKKDKRRDKFVNISGKGPTEKQKELGVVFLTFNYETKNLRFVDHHKNNKGDNNA